MRITHVIPALTKGGAEKLVVDLANEACKRGHKASIIVGFEVDRRLNADRIADGVELRAVSPAAGGKWSAYLRMPLWIWRNREWLFAQDVIHCHLTYAALFGSLVKMFRAVLGSKSPAIVETFHGVGMPIRDRQKLIASSLASGRDGFALMARDDFWQNFVDQHPNMPHAMIANGIAFDESASAEEASAWREQYGIDRDAVMVGTIGRLRAERRPDLILAAFARVAHARPDVRYVMAGDGPLTDEVRQQADALGIGDKVVLPGLIVDPAPILANLSAYLTMNVGEITGLAGLEAAAQAVPTLAIQMQDSYANGHHDWIWSDRRAEAVGDEIVRLLNSPGDRATLGKRQQNHVHAAHGIEATQTAYEALYLQAIGTRKSG